MTKAKVRQSAPYEMTNQTVREITHPTQGD